MDTVSEKEKVLEERLRQLGLVLVAFSGGVDSSYLLYTAHRVLGNRAQAVTMRLATVPAREGKEAEEFCRVHGISQRVLTADQLAIPGFSENPPDRCYLCKRFLFQNLKELAAREKISFVADGTNADDTKGYRPGLRALSELGIVSPLCEAGLSKAEIRELSRRAGLATADRPSFACMATRFPYGATITVGGLSRVEAAEDFLFAHGFTQFRVRVHGETARIEVPEADLARLLEMRKEIVRRLTDIGFLYVTMDLAGFRSGSMDEGRAKGGAGA